MSTRMIVLKSIEPSESDNITATKRTKQNSYPLSGTLVDTDRYGHNNIDMTVSSTPSNLTTSKWTQPSCSSRGISADIASAGQRTESVSENRNASVSRSYERNSSAETILASESSKDDTTSENRSTDKPDPVLHGDSGYKTSSTKHGRTHQPTSRVVSVQEDNSGEGVSITLTSSTKHDRLNQLHSIVVSVQEDNSGEGVSITLIQTSGPVPSQRAHNKASAAAEQGNGKRKPSYTYNLVTTNPQPDNVMLNSKRSRIPTMNTGRMGISILI